MILDAVGERLLKIRESEERKRKRGVAWLRENLFNFMGGSKDTSTQNKQEMRRQPKGLLERSLNPQFPFERN